MLSNTNKVKKGCQCDQQHALSNAAFNLGNWKKKKKTILVVKGESLRDGARVSRKKVVREKVLEIERFLKSVLDCDKNSTPFL